MSFLPDAARTIISFLVVLGVLVFIHEMGHYLAARWRGVHVEAFSIGFRHAVRPVDRQGRDGVAALLVAAGRLREIAWTGAARRCFARSAGIMAIRPHVPRGNRCCRVPSLSRPVLSRTSSWQRFCSVSCSEFRVSQASPSSNR